MYTIVAFVVITTVASGHPKSEPGVLAPASLALAPPPTDRSSHMINKNHNTLAPPVPVGTKTPPTLLAPLIAAQALAELTPKSAVTIAPPLAKTTVPVTSSTVLAAPLLQSGPTVAKSVRIVGSNAVPTIALTKVPLVAGPIVVKSSLESTPVRPKALLFARPSFPYIYRTIESSYIFYPYTLYPYFSSAYTKAASFI